MIRALAALTVVAVVGAELGWLVNGRDSSPFPIGGFVVTLLVLPALVALTVVGLFLVVVQWPRQSKGRLTLIAWSVGQTLLGAFFFYLTLTNTDPSMADLKAGMPVVGVIAWAGAAALPGLRRVGSERG